MAISNIGAALIAIFAFLLVVLAADCAYVIWRRRRFRRRSSTSAAVSGSASSVGGSVSGAGDASVYVLSSKELLYFLCWNNDQSRIEPSDRVANIDGHDRSADRRRDIENSAPELVGEDDDVLKLHEEENGPSRLLFTIKEEEEPTDGQDQFDHNGDDDDQKIDANEERDQSGGDDVVAEKENGVVLDVLPDSDDEATPFSTPCASPPYFTPTPSPSRDDQRKWSHESYDASESTEEFSFVRLEIIAV